MALVEGTYMHEVCEGLEEYLIAIGGPEYAEAARVFLESKPVFHYFWRDGEWVTDMTKDGEVTTSSFKLGVPYPDKIAHSAIYTTLPSKQCPMSTTTQDGNRFRTVTEMPDGNRSIREYEFIESGMTAHLSDEKFGVKAYRFYRRI